MGTLPLMQKLLHLPKCHCSRLNLLIRFKPQHIIYQGLLSQASRSSTTLLDHCIKYRLQ